MKCIESYKKIETWYKASLGHEYTLNKFFSACLRDGVEYSLTAPRKEGILTLDPITLQHVRLSGEREPYYILHMLDHLYYRIERATGRIEFLEEGALEFKAIHFQKFYAHYIDRVPTLEVMQEEVDLWIGDEDLDMKDMVSDLKERVDALGDSPSEEEVGQVLLSLLILDNQSLLWLSRGADTAMTERRVKSGEWKI